MKIIWTDGTKEVPGVGLLEHGTAYTVPDNIGEALIKQGQAEKPKKKRGE